MSLKVEIGDKTYRMASIPLDYEELKTLVINRFFTNNKNLTFRMHYKGNFVSLKIVLIMTPFKFKIKMTLKLFINVNLKIKKKVLKFT